MDYLPEDNNTLVPLRFVESYACSTVGNALRMYAGRLDEYSTVLIRNINVVDPQDSNWTNVVHQASPEDVQVPAGWIKQVQESMVDDLKKIIWEMSSAGGAVNQHGSMIIKNSRQFYDWENLMIKTARLLGLGVTIIHKDDSDEPSDNAVIFRKECATGRVSVHGVDQFFYPVDDGALPEYSGQRKTLLDGYYWRSLYGGFYIETSMTDGDPIINLFNANLVEDPYSEELSKEEQGRVILRAAGMFLPEGT